MDAWLELTILYDRCGKLIPDEEDLFKIGHEFTVEERLSLPQWPAIVALTTELRPFYVMSTENGKAECLKKTT